MSSAKNTGMNTGISGLLGNSGSFDQLGLLDMATRLACNGTLVLRYDSGTKLLLLHAGKIKASFEIGELGESEQQAVDFHFVPHHANDLPQLGSVFPESVVAVLRAIPVMGPARPLPPGIIDLRALVASIRSDGVSGALTLQHEGERALALFHDGLIGAAYFERSSHVWERGDALRAIYRYSLETGHPDMRLHRLEPEVVRSLLGLALERRAGSGDPSSFTGVSAGEGGYTFYCRGNAYLHLSAPSDSTKGRFAELESIPDLELPDDPPGWERRRFDLTLRGRDALNPMTELSMEFSEGYGQSGKRILEAVRRGQSIEETAARLELDLQSLKPWLERLESDGLIRLRR